MMCLGWSAEPTCNAPDQVQVGCATGVPLSTAGVACPDITWFWLSAAAILAGGVLKGRKKK